MSASARVVILRMNWVSSLSFLLQAGVSASLPESAQTSRDIDLSPGQPLQSNQPTGNLGVIGR